MLTFDDTGKVFGLGGIGIGDMTMDLNVQPSAAPSAPSEIQIQPMSERPAQTPVYRSPNPISQIPYGKKQNENGVLVDMTPDELLKADTGRKLKWRQQEINYMTVAPVERRMESIRLSSSMPPERGPRGRMSPMSLGERIPRDVMSPQEITDAFGKADAYVRVGVNVAPFTEKELSALSMATTDSGKLLTKDISKEVTAFQSAFDRSKGLWRTMSEAHDWLERNASPVTVMMGDSMLTQYATSGKNPKTGEGKTVAERWGEEDAKLTRIERLETGLKTDYHSDVVSYGKYRPSFDKWRDINYRTKTTQDKQGDDLPYVLKGEKEREEGKTAWIAAQRDAGNFAAESFASLPDEEKTRYRTTGKLGPVVQAVHASLKNSEKDNSVLASTTEKTSSYDFGEGEVTRTPPRPPTSRDIGAIVNKIAKQVLKEDAISEYLADSTAGLNREQWREKFVEIGKMIDSYVGNMEESELDKWNEAKQASDVTPVLDRLTNVIANLKTQTSMDKAHGEVVDLLQKKFLTLGASDQDIDELAITLAAERIAESAGGMDNDGYRILVSSLLKLESEGPSAVNPQLAELFDVERTIIKNGLAEELKVVNAGIEQEKAEVAQMVYDKAPLLRASGDSVNPDDYIRIKTDATGGGFLSKAKASGPGSEITAFFMALGNPDFSDPLFQEMIKDATATGYKNGREYPILGSDPVQVRRFIASWGDARRLPVLDGVQLKWQDVKAANIGPAGDETFAKSIYSIMVKQGLASTVKNGMTLLSSIAVQPDRAVKIMYPTEEKIEGKIGEQGGQLAQYEKDLIAFMDTAVNDRTKESYRVNPFPGNVNSKLTRYNFHPLVASARKAGLPEKEYLVASALAYQDVMINLYAKTGEALRSAMFSENAFEPSSLQEFALAIEKLKVDVARGYVAQGDAIRDIAGVRARLDNASTVLDLDVIPKTDGLKLRTMRFEGTDKQGVDFSLADLYAILDNASAIIYPEGERRLETGLPKEATPEQLAQRIMVGA